MFTANPFAELSSSVSPLLMQAYVAAMIVLVTAGTLYDMQHKKSARYFLDTWRRTRTRARQRVGGWTLASLALKTALVDVLAAGEFCNTRRRLAHLLTMYGFLLHVTATLILVFWYPTPAAPAPAILPLLWRAGAVMVCLGGAWFWLFIRVDVAAEGHSPWRIVRADLFILSLIASAAFALVWGTLQAAGNSWASVFLALYLVSTTMLFAAVPWSKFSHMFYKPAAAFQKRVENASGVCGNLPAPADKPALLGSTRREPQNY